jgi:hypothetical protein
MELPPLPLTIPPFPTRGANQAPWSANADAARNILKNAYDRALAVLRQEADPIRLKFHQERVTNDVLPILESMEESQEAEQIPIAWMEEVAAMLGFLVLHLRAAIDGVNDRYAFGKGSRAVLYILIGHHPT